jgi:hypothetical protein
VQARDFFAESEFESTDCRHVGLALLCGRGMM